MSSRGSNAARREFGGADARGVESDSHAGHSGLGRGHGWRHGAHIGSGMVESACNQFRARRAGSGMRCSRAGLERLLPIRAAIMSQRFDDVWQHVYHLPPN